MQYPLKLALQSIWNEKWINLLSILTIASGLAVVSLVIFVMYNIDYFTKRLPERFSVMIYLKDGTSESETGTIISEIRKNRNVEKLKYISKAEALNELRSTMKNSDYILEGFGENPLPASIEVKFHKEKAKPETVKLFVEEMNKIKGIDEIHFADKFLRSIHSVKTGSQTIGFMLSAIMTTGMIFLCYSTVKMLFYHRREEMETLKLLGATRGFIRLPFLLEGAIVGLAGGVTCIIALATFYYTVFSKLVSAMPALSFVVFPPIMLYMLPPAGLLLGITGALIAIGRIRF
ncbi:MAG: permease-like cell division protein FtsX [Nitrospirota bacterium]